jgi:zinc protease
VKRALLVITFVACGGATSPPHTEMAKPLASHVPDETFREHAPDVGPEIPYVPPTVTGRTLANGLRVVLAPDARNMVGVRVVMRGMANFPKTSPGLLTLLMRSVSDATATRSGADIRRTLETCLAKWSSTALDDYIEVSMTAMKGKGLDDCLELLADVVMHPAFTASNLAFELPAFAHAAQTWDEDPRLAARMVLLRTLYGEDHPYARIDVQGLEPTTTIDERAMRKLYASVAQPKTSSLVLVGGIDEHIVETSMRAFAAWSAAPSVLASSEVPPITTRVHARLVVVDRPGSLQSRLAVGALAPANGTPNAYVATLLHEMLGGVSTSRIPHTMFAQHLGSDGRTLLRHHRTADAFMFEGSAPTARTRDLLAEIDRQLTLARTTDFEFAEIEQAKTRFLRQMPSWFEQTDSLLDAIASLAAFGLPLDAYQKTYESIQSIGATDLRKLASEMLAPERVVAVVVGDWSVLEPELRALGWGPIEVRARKLKP